MYDVDLFFKTHTDTYRTGNCDIDLLYVVKYYRDYHITRLSDLKSQRRTKSKEYLELKREVDNHKKVIKVLAEKIEQDQAAREKELLESLDKIAICDSCGVRTENLPDDWLETEYGIHCPGCSKEQLEQEQMRSEAIVGAGAMPDMMSFLLEDENE